MDFDEGGRQLAGLILEAASGGQHDQVAELIAPLDTEQLRSLVTMLAVQVDQSAPSSSAAGPAAVCELAINAAAPIFGTTPEAIRSAERSRPVSDARAVAMTAVVDGDTIRVETLGGRQLGRIRLLGIDAPEVAHPPEPAECYAEDATRLLEQLAPIGSTVELVTDSSEPNRDRYDRLLRYVDHDDVDVARELLASGAALRYEADQALAREESYTAAVADAQGAERGLWGIC